MEVAKPTAIVGEIISKQEKEKREALKEERKKKAEKLLEDIPMTDEQ
jgi:hypothetical protein